MIGCDANSSVCPSGAERATIAAARLREALLTFSTTAVCVQARDGASASCRAFRVATATGG